ncbi:(Fe-S)-binding protein [Candidatus Woesearchaeota archaeon]|nr:(Fe-S)-binding protein [Candidatus Woesearchaeota archaeon]
MDDSFKCTECGLCRNACPVYKALKRETVGPRGKVMLLKEEIKDEIFYACTLCRNCTVACPLKLELDKDFRKYRAKLQEAGKTTEASKVMIENVRKYGNPFGKIEEGKKPKELFCC